MTSEESPKLRFCYEPAFVDPFLGVADPNEIYFLEDGGEVIPPPRCQRCPMVLSSHLPEIEWKPLFKGVELSRRATPEQKKERDELLETLMKHPGWKEEYADRAQRLVGFFPQFKPSPPQE